MPSTFPAGRVIDSRLSRRESWTIGVVTSCAALCFIASIAALIGGGPTWLWWVAVALFVAMVVACYFGLSDRPKVQPVSPFGPVQKWGYRP